MALIAHTTKGLSEIVVEPGSGAPRKQKEKWLRDLGKYIRSTDSNPHLITALFCHLSAAVTNGPALPPYLSPLEGFPLARQLRKPNKEIMDIKNAFATMEVLSTMVDFSLGRLIR